MSYKTALIIHNKEHRRLVDALQMIGALNRADIHLLVPGRGYCATRFDVIVVVDAPEYFERSSEVAQARYRAWLDDLQLSMPPGARITYLHPAGEPM